MLRGGRRSNQRELLLNCENPTEVTPLKVKRLVHILSFPQLRNIKYRGHSFDKSSHFHWYQHWTRLSCAVQQSNSKVEILIAVIARLTKDVKKCVLFVVIAEFQALQGGKQQSRRSDLQTGEKWERTICSDGFPWGWNIAPYLPRQCQPLLCSSHWYSTGCRATASKLNRNGDNACQNNDCY